MPSHSRAGAPVICLAHVTNQMGTIEGDFEKREKAKREQPMPLGGRRLVHHRAAVLSRGFCKTGAHSARARSGRALPSGFASHEMAPARPPQV